MAERRQGAVNNDVYHALGERWYTAKDHPVALLRAEARTRNSWVLQEIHNVFLGRPMHVLDLGCGAGFLANALARHGVAVTGLDASASSLEVAKQHDTTRTVTYTLGDAYHLPYADASFEVVCAMDFLEHVEAPARVVQEAARVVKPQGLCFFHTFNRNVLSYLVVIKGVEWFVKNTPPNLHILKLFIKPAELRAMCAASGLRLTVLRGLAPKLTQPAFWRMLRTGMVADDFEFIFTKSRCTGYIGLATKE
jgi:2-polyprenyl-6-hydroxyphenyl methylase/3-demethylubiquinone-9 3-methyltransferase